MSTSGATPAVVEAERCLVATSRPGVLRWRIESVGRLTGAAWIEYEETRRGALVFVASGSHPSARGRAVPSLVRQIADLHPRSVGWYLVVDALPRESVEAVRAVARERELFIQHI